MTNFLGTRWHSGDKLLCCWPQSPPSELTCFALLLLGASQHWAVTHSDRGTRQMFSSKHGQHVRHMDGLQAFWLQFLTPLQLPAASFVFLCLFAPCRIRMWLPDSQMCLWEAQALLFCNQLCSWSQADASYRCPGAVGHIWGTFSLKWKHHLGHVLEEEVFGCFWWVLLTFLIFHTDFGKLF